jgi:acetyl esterase/lipase
MALSLGMDCFIWVKALQRGRSAAHPCIVYMHGGGFTLARFHARTVFGAAAKAGFDFVCAFLRRHLHEA